MKKIYLYFLLAALMGFIHSSCTDDLNLLSSSAKGDGLSLTMTLSMPEMQSMQTRGVLDDSDLNPDALSQEYIESLRLYMFIFEDAGSPESNYLRTLVHGDEITPDGFEEPDEKHSGQILRKYTAKVDGTSENAIIHLVATADPDFEKQLQNSVDRSELGLFFGSTGLYTSRQYPAFWKRIDLKMPIKNDDESKAQIEEKLSHVQMVRNFCRMTVKLKDFENAEEQKNALNDFHLEGYTLVNQIDHGYIAAYSDSKHDFVEFEAADKDDQGKLTLNGAMRDYTSLYQVDKYFGNRHPLSKRNHAEESASSWLLNEGEDKVFTLRPKYMFERPYQEQHRTFVIIKGYFGALSESTPNYRYIKLDIGSTPDWLIDDEQGFVYHVFEPYNLLRNFSYDITINHIASSSVGHATAEEAIDAPSVNNVTASVEIKSLQDISDGVDRMQVNMTKIIIVDDDNGDPYPKYIDLKWRYLADWKNASCANHSDYVRYDYPNMALWNSDGNDDSGIISTTKTVPTKYTSSDPTDNNLSLSDKDWRGFRLEFNRPDETIRQKTVRLYYANPEDNSPNVRLSRDITFVMRKRWKFVDNRPDVSDHNVEVYPGAYSYDNGTMPYESLDEMRDNVPVGLVGSQAGAQLTVMFELPPDLPQSIFPLDFTIEADRQNIENAYIGNATVITGPSLFSGQGASPRTKFVKTVTWDYYHGSGDFDDKGHRIVCVRFLTTTDVLYETGNGTDVTSMTKIRVKNPYFELGNDDFERAAHEDVVDPTRTRWYWNFSYPEWATYFTTYYNKLDDPHTLNNLHFDNPYYKGSASGNYILAGELQTNRSENGVLEIEDGSSHSKSAFYFPVNFNTSDYSEGIVKVVATVNRIRDKISGSNFKLYDRDIYVGLYDENGQIVGETLKCIGGTGTGKKYADCNQESDKIKSPETFSFSISQSNIPANKDIKEIRIWSTQDSDPNQSSNHYDPQPESTRYYSIEFTLSPK